MPNYGGNRIHHLVKTFENEDFALLDVEMNVWFLSLEAIEQNPIIQRVNFNTVLSAAPATLLYQSQVHYILVG